MKMRLLVGLVALSCAIIAGCQNAAMPDAGATAAAAAAYDVPRIDGLKIDADAAKWQGRGLAVNTLGNADFDFLPGSDFKPFTDFAAQCRLAWDDRGIIALVAVKDSTPVENESIDKLWQGDSVEFLASPNRGSPEIWQLLVSPGVDPKQPQARTRLMDFRSKTNPPRKNLRCEMARAKTADGYAIEVLLPWENLQLSPHMGDVVAFQLQVNNVGSDGKKRSLRWQPRDGAYRDSNLMRTIRLTEKAGAPVDFSAVGDCDAVHDAGVTIMGPIQAAGQEVSIVAGDKVLAMGKLAAGGPGSYCLVTVPFPPAGQEYPVLIAQVAGREAARVDMPPLAVRQAVNFALQPIAIQQFVFSGESFPRCNFKNSLEVERLIGRYKLAVTWYDAQYNVVTEAKKPGRYGAVIEITAADGRTHRRFATAYRQPNAANWHYWYFDVKLNARLELPRHLEIDPQVAAKYAPAINESLKWWIWDKFDNDSSGAVLLAGLAEAKAGGEVVEDEQSLATADRQWWVGLKRKLYGWDKTYPNAFVCPVKADKPVPALHEGTAAEAGMKADTVANIDALCTQWAADTDEPFSVCIARHGVVFFHKAYDSGDKKLTVDTPRYMASITKLMAGTLLTMVLDQGLLDLDTPIDQYLPDFRGIKVAKPLTLRHCFTHTSGLMNDDLDDDCNDLESRLAEMYATLEVGKRYNYNGVGLALGSKAIEAVSGESIPMFYRKHLLEPLGCQHTAVCSSSWDARSTPMDMARIGQLLLNKGAYGDKRFFSEKSFDYIFPRKLTKILGPDTQTVYGLGTGSYAGENGLSQNAFGHGAASSATLRIDPDNDLVIVMCRNNAGKNFDKYHGKFLETITGGMDKPATVPATVPATQPAN